MPLFKENVSLSEYSNYKIGGPARYFFTARNEDGLKKALMEAQNRKLKIFFLGGATNLLIPDKGFNGLVVRCAFNELKRSDNDIHVGAGVSMAKLIRFAAKENLAGLEWAGGLPGTVGGAIRGNAGCFGGETKDSIRSVRSMDAKTFHVLNRSRVGCRFGYRSSVYKERQGDEVVLSAVFRLKKGKYADIWQIAKKNMDWRKERHPLQYPNIGSIFKNIPVAGVPKRWQKELAQNPKMDPFPVVPAARIIARAGLTGKKHGGAMISVKHTNFIVNVRRAKSSDVLYLIKFVQRTIKKRYGIAMEPEVQIL
jgi:UDP-N-acetylmuramate dehydrogenase